MQTASVYKEPSSFRDPSGFIFHRDGILYRQIETSYQEHYDHLMVSGLYAALQRERLLIPHTEASLDLAPQPGGAYKVIQPERLNFVSYPYEWGFSQLKDAALITLQIQKKAVECGMVLKDASAFNIQRHQGRLLLIDTLSFEKYHEGDPWVAYRQFCQHFLAPLALMSRCDIRFGQLSRLYLDGIPLDLTAKLLPFRCRLNGGLLGHIYLHAGAQTKLADKNLKPAAQYKVSRYSLLAIIDHLESTVRGLCWKAGQTEWADYYNATNYQGEAFRHKQECVSAYLDKINPKQVWDLGGNTGVFSRLASRRGIHTVCFDIDPSAVEINYLESIKHQELSLEALILDLTNPSPASGWAHRERASFQERSAGVDLVLALALVHHLAISNNLPLEKIAEFFSRLGRALVIEFIPKPDSQVQRLLRTRKDIFPHYHEDGFEKAFGQYFEILDKRPIVESHRSLYLMKPGR